MIPLVKNTISFEEIKRLAEWLQTNPRLTRNTLCEDFEYQWSQWLGVKYSHFVNSGSSANLLIFEALKQSGRLRSNNVVVPAVSWVTSVTPVVQTGLNPLLCDADEETLGLNIDHLEKLLKENDISVVLIVHVLGVPNKMEEILELQMKYNFIIIEDSCEAVGSTYKGMKIGTFGLMSSFSYYYGHHLSTIEGGMVCSNDSELYNLVKSIASHGWARDLPENYKRSLELKYDIDPFNSFYTFYHNGYNLRATDLNAFLGLSQLESIDKKIAKRNVNYKRYLSNLKDFYCQKNEHAFISNFAYGILNENKKAIVQNLFENGIECRPLICGSIGRQPFWTKTFGVTELPFADKVHFNGFYVPNNDELTPEEIDFISETIIKSC